MEYFLKTHHIHKVHFVGIGGISMSALAKLCLNNGLKVSGSDVKSSYITDELASLGIKIFIGHNKNNILDADTIVYTIAVKESNEEVVEAKRLRLNVLERSDFLSLLSQEYKNVIAVAGTHGKTTTCGMLASIFISAQKDPTVHMGGECDIIGGNLRIGDKNFFITEACEYKKHLLKIAHNVGVVLNIEPDHPDSYKNGNDLHDTFDKFCEMSKELSVINENHMVLLKNSNFYKTLTFSCNNFGNFTAKNIKQYKSGKISFNCYKNGKFYANFELSLFGKHNVMNALACIAVADYYSISKLYIAKGLKNFSGVKRRFQFMGKINDNIVIEDYAHHPTEIKTVIKCAKEIFNKKIVAVFQPHTYTRTKSLLTEFLNCFKQANEIVVLPTYSAREKPIKKASGKYLAKCLNNLNFNCKYVQSFTSAKKYLYKVHDSIILIIGAGNIENLAIEIKRDYLKLEQQKYSNI